MDSVDEMGFGTEVGCVVDFVFEEDACDFVGRETRGLNGRGGDEVEVGVESAGLDGEHEVACLMVNSITDILEIALCVVPRFSMLMSPVTLPHILIA